MSQEKVKKPAPQKQEETKPVCPKQADKAKVDESTKDIIDEIDEILEQDAEEFVKNYVQRGGE
jgi:ubiquitin-like protein Pup